MIRVFLADDQRLFREGLRILLAAQGVDVVGEAGTGDATVRLVGELLPDVVIMDLRMPLHDAPPGWARTAHDLAAPANAALGGVSATRQIVTLPRAPRVIALTTFDDDELVFEALRAGALGYLLKDAPAARLIEAIELAARGESLLQPSVAAKLVAEFARLAPQGQKRNRAAELGLSERELSVLSVLARGASNKEIAVALRIAEGTVKNHVTSILIKLGVDDRTQAALKARDCGVI
jgi:DNA-binding NarL/FixJ family response regulator